MIKIYHLFIISHFPRKIPIGIMGNKRKDNKVSNVKCLILRKKYFSKFIKKNNNPLLQHTFVFQDQVVLKLASYASCQCNKTRKTR